MAALPGGDRRESDAAGARYELAGPETLTHREIVETALRSFGRRRPIVGVPAPIVRRGLKRSSCSTGPDRVRHLG